MPEPIPIAVVTGGNRGLGRETCRQLAARGYRVYLTARLQEGAEAAAAELAGDVRPRELDVTDEASAEALTAELYQQGLRVDALVNNAGVMTAGGDAESVRQTLDVNLFGPMRVADALLPVMAAQGRIVMVSSGLGRLARLPDWLRARLEDPALDREGLVELMWRYSEAVMRGEQEREGWPGEPYGLSKAALNAFTRILDRELEQTALQVNAVTPGWVRTRMGGEAAPESVAEGADTIVWAATLTSDGPRGLFLSQRQPTAW